MIEIRQVKVPINDANQDYKPYIAKALRIDPGQIISYKILKQSIDARKKPELYYIFSFAVTLKDEKKIENKHKKNANILVYQPKTYHVPISGEKPLTTPPIIIGMGPAGLFCGYALALAGFCPIIIERGQSVTNRTKDVLKFWEEGVLNPESNVQFGEGGAGTFSDGKLNTLVKDKFGRNSFVLETFVKFGAPDKILWEAKPHIGTDILMDVVANIRDEIISLGGKVCFQEKFEHYYAEDGLLKEISTNKSTLKTEVLVLAIGHSARDTFQELYQSKLSMSAKEFAVGFRIEHPQEMIDFCQYGRKSDEYLPVSPYKLATKLDNQRGVYSFCMCPGGYVVNASSIEQRLVVNGMSYSKRDSRNANSAIVVSVGANEFDLQDPMGAIAYQTAIEKRAYELGNGRIPQQLYGDFKKKIATSNYGEFSSETKGQTVFAPLHEIYSSAINDSFIQGMDGFAKKIKGFDRYDAILSGVESRTSSPIRIHRDEAFESNIKGIYPCGEGAGYAGGIMSAAMDGLKVAEEIIKKYKVSYE